MARVPTPKKDEPIRLFTTVNGVPRYRAVVTVSPKGVTPRKQLTKTFGSLAEARRFVTDTRESVTRGNFTAPRKITVNELIDAWLSSRQHVRERTVYGYQGALKHARRQFGTRLAQSITRPEVDAWVNSLATSGGPKGSGYSHRTIQYALNAFTQVLEYGVTSEILARNAAQHVKPPRRKKGDRKRVVPWSIDELLRFRSAADQDRLAALWRLTLCGLRRSEVAGLAWDEVDLEAGTVHVAYSRVGVGGGKKTQRDGTKSDAGDRTIRVDDLHPGTVALLRSLKARQAEERLAAGQLYSNPDNLVAVNELGHGVHPDTYSTKFRELCDRAGVRRIGIHTVRHTISTLLHESGVAPASGAALLGHTVAVHLDVYVTATERGAQAAGRALGDALRTAAK